MTEQKAQQTEAETKKPEPEFAIHRIYSKDISVEPKTPETFRMEWKPDVNLDMDIKTSSLGDDLHEVVIKLTTTVKIGDKTAYLIEINQAGIFLLKGFEKENLQYMLGCFCPNILFPFGRELIADLVNRSGFPPLYLAPINFEAYYNQHLAQQKKPDQN